MRKFLPLLFIPLYLGADASGCADAKAVNGRESEIEASKRQQDQYAIAQPVPAFDFSLERARMIEMYTARQSAAQTWSVWRAYSGLVTGWCPSSGFPIPYGTQLTPPDVIVTNTHGADGISTSSVSNPEPNGLYTGGAGSPGTWVFCVVDGEISPVYIEDNVTVYGYPVTVDEKTGHVERIGAPTVKLTK